MWQVPGNRVVEREAAYTTSFHVWRTKTNPRYASGEQTFLYLHSSLRISTERDSSSQPPEVTRTSHSKYLFIVHFSIRNSLPYSLLRVPSLSTHKSNEPTINIRISTMAFSIYIMLIFSIVVVLALYDAVTAMDAATTLHGDIYNIPGAEKKAIGRLWGRMIVCFGSMAIVWLVTGGLGDEERKKKKRAEAVQVGQGVEGVVKGTNVTETAKATEGAGVAEGTGVTTLPVVERDEQGGAIDEASVMAQGWDNIIGEGKIINLEVTPMDDSTVVWPVVCTDSPEDGLRTCTVSAHGNLAVKLTVELRKDV
jgi:hypothetical protein